MDVDLDELRANLSKFKKYGKGFDVNDLDWLDSRRKIKAVTIFFYETSVWKNIIDNIQHPILIEEFSNKLSVLIILFAIIFLRRTLKKEKVFSFIKISTIDYTCTFKGTKIKIHDFKKNLNWIMQKIWMKFFYTFLHWKMNQNRT